VSIAIKGPERFLEKIVETPLEKTQALRKGWLKNGNPLGNPNLAPRCGAKTRQGTSCRAPAMGNGRCRMHGGASTGPRTPAGLARSKRARWKHGLYSAVTVAERRRARELLRESLELLKRL
jgi:hypothetical protein